MHFKTFRFCIHATVLIPGAEHRPVVGGALEPWEKAPNEKKHSLLTFKHFLFYFHDIFFPIFFPYVLLWSETSRKKYQKNVFFK